jgi:hypothetical protein
MAMAIGNDDPMPVCPHCSQLVEEGPIFCAHCFGPMKATVPPSRRVLPWIAMLSVFALAFWLICRVVDGWVR